MICPPGGATSTRPIRQVATLDWRNSPRGIPPLRCNHITITTYYTTHLVNNACDFETFLHSFDQQDILSWAILQRPNSEWVCDLVTNVTFYINLIKDHPIGCPQITLPDYVQNNQGLNALVCDMSKTQKKPLYTDNLCFFRCLALSRGADINRLERHVEALYKMYEECTPDTPPLP